MTRLRVERPGVKILAGQKFFSPQRPNPTGTDVPSREQSGRGVQLTIHVHPVPRIRMSGAIPLAPYTRAVHKETELFS